MNTHSVAIIHRRRSSSSHSDEEDEFVGITYSKTRGLLEPCVVMATTANVKTTRTRAICSSRSGKESTIETNRMKVGH